MIRRKTERSTDNWCWWSCVMCVLAVIGAVTPGFGSWSSSSVSLSMNQGSSSGYWAAASTNTVTGWVWSGAGVLGADLADSEANPRLAGPWGGIKTWGVSYRLDYSVSLDGYVYSAKAAGPEGLAAPGGLNPGATFQYIIDNGTDILNGYYTIPKPMQVTSHAMLTPIDSDLLATIGNVHSNEKGKLTNSFHFTPAFTPNTNAKQRSTLEHALHALEASGPLNLVKGQTRLWLCGYKSGGRVQTLTSNPGYHSSNVGALMGTEYRSLKDKWTVGLLLGTVVGKQTQATVRETFTNSKGINYGVYGSISPVDGLRFDAVLTNLNMVLNHQRYDAASNQTAYAKYKMNTLIGDVMASYTWKLPRDYSVRFNVGNTYVGNHADGFNEVGASVNFMQKSSTLKVHEVYGGIGLRKGWMVDKLLWRLTGSYEIGRQYYHKGRAIQVSYLGGTPITITNGPLRLNHYLNANLSVLQEAIGLKGVLAYTATLSPKAKTQGKSIRQMVSVKCELRF